MGFASFVAGDVGQRIVLKSGLLPVRIPTRKFTIVGKDQNKLNTITMNKFKFFSVALLASALQVKHKILIKLKGYRCRAI
jgi:hypothetical protein